MYGMGLLTLIYDKVPAVLHTIAFIICANVIIIKANNILMLLQTYSDLKMSQGLPWPRDHTLRRQ